MAATLHVVTQDEETGLGKPLPVRLSRIEAYQAQPRRFFNPTSIEELADDIQMNGQKSPVRVCKHSSKSGVFVLIGGERRWRAFGKIRERTNTDPLINCFIDTVNNEQHHFREAFLDNLQREDLIPVDEAAAYQRLYKESTADSYQEKLVEVARLSKRSTTHVKNYLYLVELSEPVKKMLDPLLEKENQLNISSAIDIAKSTKNPALQLELAKEAVERQLAVVEVKALISVKVGGTGYGIGGSMRKPVDAYRTLKNFIGNVLIRSRRLSGLDIEAVYKNRDDDIGDRERDARLLQELIGHLTDLHKKVDDYPKRSTS